MLPKIVNIQYLDYATNTSTTFPEFLGFVEFNDPEGHWWIGFKDIDNPDIKYVPLLTGYHPDHELENEIIELHYGNKHKVYIYDNEVDFLKTYPWVLFLRGNDDSSLFFRFKTKEEIEPYINTILKTSSFEDIWKMGFGKN